MMDTVTEFTTEPTGDVLSVDAGQGGTVQEIKTEDVTVEDSSTKQVEQSVEVETSENVADMDDSPQTHKGHNVPYKRFKNVLDARNNFRSEAENYRNKISSLEQKLSNLDNSRPQIPQAPPAEEKSWLDNYLSPEEAAPEWQQPMAKLNDRLYQFEVAREEATLRADLTQIESQYPSVPTQMLLKAVIQDPNVDIFKLAEGYQSHISGIEEQAIARHVKSQESSVSSFE